MSAIITLHRLGRLTLAANYFGKLILPASYGDFPLRDAQRLTPHQPSREQELRHVHDLVQRRLIMVVEDGDVPDGMSLVDEYHVGGDDHHFALADVAQFLRATQRLTSDELDDFSRACHRAMQSDRELPRDARVLFAVGTLRSLARFGWLERVLPSVNWCVARTDYDDEVRELQEYEFQRSIFSSHQTMWEEINQLRADGKLEYRDSATCRRDCDDDTDDGDVEPSSFFDAMLLAHDLGCRLLADDRLCQAAVLNERPEVSDAAFGTDRLLVGLEDKGVLSTDDVSADLIRMIRWRCRFLLPESRHLKVAALRSRDSLPGPELREIAAYVQESMRDPGLFCGPEKADLPTPVAFKYFMAWKQVCVEFLGSLWEDSSITSPQLEAVTGWCIESLLPAVPRGMLDSPVGRRLGDFTPKAFMLTAMIRFATVQPVQRANEALRLMASHLGLTEEEFYEAAAEAADGSLRIVGRSSAAYAFELPVSPSDLGLQDTPTDNHEAEAVRQVFAARRAIDTGTALKDLLSELRELPDGLSTFLCASLRCWPVDRSHADTAVRDFLNDNDWRRTVFHRIPLEALDKLISFLTDWQLQQDAEWVVRLPQLFAFECENAKEPERRDLLLSATTVSAMAADVASPVVRLLVGPKRTEIASQFDKWRQTTREITCDSEAWLAARVRGFLGTIEIVL